MSSDPEHRPSTCREFIEDLTGHSTRKLTPLGTDVPVQDIWYLVYRDDEGEQHTVKGSTAAIRRSLKDRLLGDASNVRASRSKTGPFESLRAFPEFRDMVMQLPEATASAPASGASKPLATPIGPGSSARRLAVANAAPVQAQALVGEAPAPHIDLGPPPRRPEWLKTALLAVVLFLVAVVTATVAFFLIPK